MPANTNIKATVSEFRGCENGRRVFYSHAYGVWDTEPALVIDDDRFNADGEQMYAIVGPEALCFRWSVLRAYVSYDSKKYLDGVQRIRIILMLDELVAKLERIDSKDPMKEFTKISGKAKKYFDAEADDRSLRFALENNPMTFTENRAGLSMMLSSTNVG